ncbi:MAG: lipopolysaccharide biosynthesis protein, partial [Microbacterium sp.]
VAQAMRALDAALAVLCGIAPADKGATAPRIDPAALAAAAELDDLPGLFETALTWDAAKLAPMRAAMIGWCLSRPSLRDIALVQWASDVDGGDLAIRAQQRWESGGDYPADVAEVMWGEGPRPDPQRLETALELCRTVAALLPNRRRAGALAVCGWLAWALGRSTHADHYATQALHSEPAHGLAAIVHSFVAAAHLPDWAFRPC